MPTYVYECKSCTTVFEADQSIKDDPLTTCVSCHVVGSIKRVIQPVGISFKGSGFYVNDSKSVSSSKPLDDSAIPTEAETAKAAATPETPAAPAPAATPVAPAAAAKD